MRSSLWRCLFANDFDYKKEVEEENVASKIGPWLANRVHQAECLSALREVPDDSFDVAATSPPYWGQRGDTGLGSEKDPREYVTNLVAVLNEVMRCLKPTGTLWLNIGDSYNTPINWRAIDSNYSTLGKNGTGHAADNQIYQKDRGRRRPFLDKKVSVVEVRQPSRYSLPCGLGPNGSGLVLPGRSRVVEIPPCARRPVPSPTPATRTDLRDREGRAPSVSYDTARGLNLETCSAAEPHGSCVSISG